MPYAASPYQLVRERPFWSLSCSGPVLECERRAKTGKTWGAKKPANLYMYNPSNCEESLGSELVLEPRETPSLASFGGGR